MRVIIWSMGDFDPSCCHRTSTRNTQCFLSPGHDGDCDFYRVVIDPVPTKNVGPRLEVTDGYECSRCKRITGDPDLETLPPCDYIEGRTCTLVRYFYVSCSCGEGGHRCRLATEADMSRDKLTYRGSGTKLTIWLIAEHGMDRVLTQTHAPDQYQRDAMRPSRIYQVEVDLPDVVEVDGKIHVTARNA